MKTYNYSYVDEIELKKFIKENQFNIGTCFIQIFSGIIDKSIITKIIQILKENINNPIIIGASTAGEIISGEIKNKSIVISFNVLTKTNIKSFYCNFSSEISKETCENIIFDNTKLILVLADGYSFETEYFLKKFHKKYPNILIGGGKAGDNLEFKTSFVFDNNGIYEKGMIITSFSSDDLIVNNSFNFDWMPIGKELTITKSKENIIYEIDNIPVIQIYEKYLGKLIADDLPGIGLEFPLIINRNGIDVGRGPIGKVENGGLLLTGLVNTGEKVRLGFGNKGNILYASKNNFQNLIKFPIESIFVYSCAARKILLGEDTGVEFVNISKNFPISGFFTYSEFFYNKENIELFSYCSTFICISESNECKKNIANFEYNKVEDKIMYALSNFINTTSQELIQMNGYLNKKVKEKVEQIEKEKNNYLEVYKQIIDNMIESIVILDKDRNFVYVNKKGEEIIGYNLEELNKIGILQLFTENTVIEYKKNLPLRMRGEISTYNGEIKTRSSGILPVKITGIPFIDGGTVGVLQNLNDLNKLKKLNNELLNKNVILHEYKKALDITSYIVRLDGNKNITYVNTKFTDFEGYDNTKKNIGLNHLEISNSSIRYTDKTLKNRISLETIYKLIEETKKNWSGISEKKDLYGDIHWFQNYIIPVIDYSGNIVEYISISSDITQFIEYEKQLKESYEKLKELDEKKTNFLNIASHELRTPLTSINGYISMILDRDFGEINFEVNKYLSLVSGSLDNLLVLISDMLDISRIESGKHEFIFEKFDLNELINIVINELSPIRNNKKIDLNFVNKSCNIEIISCKKSVRKIITNLLGNAIKYTNNGGEIFIELKNDEENFIIDFIDNGIGIDKKDFEKIFEKFGQAGDSLNKESKGTGLGLAIVKEFIKNIDGQIFVESELGKGSKFTILLPKNKSI